MALIFEIAGGIILAVVILAFWPFILLGLVGFGCFIATPKP